MLNEFEAKDFVEVEFAGQQVKVLAGGYYDRFRSNPDLDAEFLLPRQHRADAVSGLCRETFRIIARTLAASETVYGLWLGGADLVFLPRLRQRSL